MCTAVLALQQHTPPRLYAEQLIGQGRPQEVPAVLGGELSLAATYPQRHSFHSAEVVAFHTLMCLYFLEEGGLYPANIHQSTLLSAEVPEGMPLNSQVLIRLNTAIAGEMEEVPQEARQSEE